MPVEEEPPRCEAPVRSCLSPPENVNADAGPCVAQPSQFETACSAPCPDTSIQCPGPHRPATAIRSSRCSSCNSLCCACFTCWAAQPFHLLAVIKFLTAAAVLSPLTCVTYLIISIVLWPHDIFLTYRAVSKTKMLGPNIKTLAMLLLPVPLLLWPIVAAAVGFCMGVMEALEAGYLPSRKQTHAQGMNLLYTCSIEICYRGYAKAGKGAVEGVQNFWNWMLHSYFAYLEELMEDIEEPFDIHILQLLACLLISPLGAVLGLVGCCLPIWKLPFGLLRMEYDIVRLFLKQESWFEACLLFLPWLLLLLLAPAFVLLIVALVPVLGFIYGFGLSGVKAYQADAMLEMLPAGLSPVYMAIVHMDCATSEMAFGSKLISCLPKWEYAAEAPIEPEVPEPRFGTLETLRCDASADADGKVQDCGGSVVLVVSEGGLGDGEFDVALDAGTQQCSGADREAQQAQSGETSRLHDIGHGTLPPTSLQTTSCSNSDSKGAS